jgi:hypothetical protein
VESANYRHRPQAAQVRSQDCSSEESRSGAAARIWFHTLDKGRFRLNSYLPVSLFRCPLQQTRKARGKKGAGQLCAVGAEDIQRQGAWLFIVDSTGGIPDSEQPPSGNLRCHSRLSLGGNVRRSNQELVKML